MTQVSAHYLADILAKCVALGVSRDVLMECIAEGEEAFSDPIRRLPSQYLLDIYEKVAVITQQDHIGLVVGQQVNVATMFESGKILPMCSNLREVVSMVGRYHRLTQTFGRTRLVEVDGLAHVIWDAHYDDPYPYQPALTSVYAGFVYAGRWILWGQSYEFISIDFRIDEPVNSHIYEQVLGCPVRFGQSKDCLTLDAKYLDLPIVSANPAMFDAMTERLDKLLSVVDDENFVVDSVCASIRRQIRDHAPTMEVAAEHANIPVRRIRRALTQNGTSFRKLVDKERMDACQRYFRRGLRAGEIAYSLGYHDQAAFTRAFRRWHGMSPSDYRRQMR